MDLQPASAVSVRQQRILLIIGTMHPSLEPAHSATTYGSSININMVSCGYFLQLLPVATSPQLSVSCSSFDHLLHIHRVII